MRVLAASAATALAASMLCAQPADAVQGTAECDTFKAGVVSGVGKVCLGVVWNTQKDGHGTRIHRVDFWSPDGVELEAGRALDFSPLLIKSGTGVQKWARSGSLSRSQAYVGYTRSWGTRHPMLVNARAGYVCAFWKAHVDNAPDDSGSFCIRIT